MLVAKEKKDGLVHLQPAIASASLDLGARRGERGTYSLFPGAVVLSVTREAVDEEAIVGRVLHGLLEERNGDEAGNDLSVLDHGGDCNQRERKRGEKTSIGGSES